MSTPSPDTPKLGKKHKILLRLERFSRQRYWVVFLVFLAVSFVAETLIQRVTKRKVQPEAIQARGTT